VAGEPALHVAVDPRGELRGQLLRIRRLRARPVGELRLPVEPDARRVRDEAVAQPLDGLRPVTHQCDAMARQLRVPRRQRATAGTPRPDARDQRVALAERRGVRPPCPRAPGPERRDDLVEVGTAQRRGTEHELEPVRQEHRDQRPRGGVGQPLHGRAVDAQPLRLAGLEADADLVAATVVLRLEHQPRERRAEADDLALVGGAAGAARAGEVDPLEQVGLAGAVAPGDDGQPRPRAQLRLLVGAEVAQLEPGDPHGPGTAPPLRR
jgi:hypothetical protein